jgi:hypothetical protein
MTQGGSGFKGFGLGAAGAAFSTRETRYFVHKATKATAGDVCAVSFVAFAMAKGEISAIKGRPEGRWMAGTFHSIARRYLADTSSRYSDFQRAASSIPG